MIPEAEWVMATPFYPEVPDSYQFEAVQPPNLDLVTQFPPFNDNEKKYNVSLFLDWLGSRPEMPTEIRVPFYVSRLHIE